jgi:hypothetical protein
MNVRAQVNGPPRPIASTVASLSNKTDKGRCALAKRERGERRLPFAVRAEDQAVPFTREFRPFGD